jgi:hypothetical protein
MRSPRWLAYFLVLFPLIGLGLAIAVNYQNQYLLRRDENILFVVLATMQQNRSGEDIFTMIFAPSLLAILSWLAQFSSIIAVGRGMAWLSALACALLVAQIAKRLVPERANAPLLSLALMLSSSLFMVESTYARFNLPSLAFSLGGILLLLDLQPKQWGKALAAGALLSCALLIKPLMLAVMPFVAYLVWRSNGNEQFWRPNIANVLTNGLAHALGWLIPILLTILFMGMEALRVSNQLGAHLSETGIISLAMRLSHSINIMLEFAQAHMWIVLLSIALFLGNYAFASATIIGKRSQNALLVWLVTVGGVLLLNFPTWEHHMVYILAPLAICGAAMLDYLGQLFWSQLSPQQQKRLPSSTLVQCAGLLLALSGMFGALQQTELHKPAADVPAARALIEQNTTADQIIWSDNLIFPLLSQRPSEAMLLDFSIKRIITGQLTEPQVQQWFAQRPPSAIIVYDGLFEAFPNFMRCINQNAEQSIISLNKQRIYWIDQQSITNCS